MNRFHAALPRFARKYIWNAKYGLLRYPQLAPPEDAVRYLADRMPESGSLLELGCGRGSLIRGLRRAGWTGCYCGVDISSQAIADAAKFGDQRSAWILSDLESFRSPFRWDVVTMIESAYYIRLDRFPRVLEQIMEMVADSGIFLARFHDFDRHRAYVDSIRRFSSLTETVGGSLLSVPRALSSNSSLRTTEVESVAAV